MRRTPCEYCSSVAGMSDVSAVARRAKAAATSGVAAIPAHRFAHAAYLFEYMDGKAAVNEPQSSSPFQAIRAIDYTVIFVRDMAAMRRFYEGILRFRLTRELSPNWIEYQIGGNTLALAKAGRAARDGARPAGSG